MKDFSDQKNRIEFAQGLINGVAKLRPEGASRINLTFEDTPDSLLERVTIDFPNGAWATIALNTPFKIMKVGEEGDAPRDEKGSGVRARIERTGNPETLREAIAEGMQAARETAQGDEEHPYVRTSDVENWVRASVTDFIRNALAPEMLQATPGTLASELMRRLEQRLLK